MCPVTVGFSGVAAEDGPCSSCGSFSCTGGVCSDPRGCFFLPQVVCYLCADQYPAECSGTLRSVLPPGVALLSGALSCTLWPPGSPQTLSSESPPALPGPLPHCAQKVSRGVNGAVTGLASRLPGPCPSFPRVPGLESTVACLCLIFPVVSGRWVNLPASPGACRAF